MLALDPVAGFCTAILTLYIISTIGEYDHPSSRIKKSVNRAIGDCSGSWNSQLSLMLSYIWFGASYTELEYKDVTGNRKGLNRLRTLDPELYDFKVDDGEISKVEFIGGGETIYISYHFGCHLVNRVGLSFDHRWGLAQAKAALPFWELHKVLIPVLAIAGQRQATPILVQKTETGAKSTPQLENLW
jgi:hypothetical protein